MSQYVRLFSYHFLYTESDLVADCGGYLGLFLGVSVFSLVEVIEKSLRVRKKEEAAPRNTGTLETPEEVALCKS